MPQWHTLKDYAPGSGDRLVAEFDYAYNSRGDRTSALEEFDTDGGTVPDKVQKFTWAYDSLDRLTAETYDLGNDGSSAGDYVTTYGFDLDDNRAKENTEHDYSGPVSGMTADETAGQRANAEDLRMGHEDKQ